METDLFSKQWTTIPILPCPSIVEALSFWESLGFTITYKQTRPYQYGVVTRGGHELHFAGVKTMDAKYNFYNGCLVMVLDAEKTYQEFAEIFKQRFGKVPHSGIPRISRMKPAGTRFTLTDVAGNSIIFVSFGEDDQAVWEKADDHNQSRLQKAIATAIRFRDYKNDDSAAAKTLDAALRHAGNGDKLDLAEALIIRIELADFRNQRARAEECRTRLSEMQLHPEEIAALKQKHRTNQL